MMYIGILFIFISLLLFVMSILNILFNKPKAIDKLKVYDENYNKSNTNESIKKNKEGILRRLSKLIPNSLVKSMKGNRLEIDLIRADLLITVEELFILKVVSTSLICLIIYGITKDIILLIVFGAIVWNLPRFIISIKKAKRLKAFNEQINEGIMIITNSLKAGYSFLQAIAVVVEETRDPFAKEFKKLLKEMSLGVTIDESLKNMLNRVESEDLKLIVNAILIQKDIGGNLSEILDNIGLTIRERQKVQNELKTLTSQGKLSGLIVVLIPVALGFTLYLLNKEYIMLLFTTKIGLIMIILALISQFIGILIINNIVKIEM